MNWYYIGRNHHTSAYHPSVHDELIQQNLNYGGSQLTLSSQAAFTHIQTYRRSRSFKPYVHITHFRLLAFFPHSMHLISFTSWLLALLWPYLGTPIRNNRKERSSGLARSTCLSTRLKGMYYVGQVTLLVPVIFIRK